MKNKLFELSPFWSFLSFFTVKRCALILLIFAIVFEIMANIAPLIWGKHVHRPFTVSYAKCKESCDYQGTRVKWYANEKGARGSLYQGQSTQIATFGSSTTANSLISQQYSWPEQLKIHLESDSDQGNSIHVDNFAKDGAGNKEIEAILKNLIAQQASYDAILIMDHFSHEEREVSDTIAFTDWGKHSSNHPVKTPELLKNALLDSIKNLVNSNMVLTALKEKVSSSANTMSDKYPHPNPLDVKNRELRKSGQIKLIDLPDEGVTAEKKAYIQTRMKTLLRLASQISDKVYFVIQPVAYDEQELPGVSQKWFSLYPTSETEPVYLSNKTVARRVRNVQQVIAEYAKQNQVATINLDGYLKPQLRLRDDLFFDKWHLSPQGNEVAGAYIAEQLDL